jgi:hypothetical protein
MPRLIRTHATSLIGRQPRVAHEHQGWDPEHKNSNFHEHPMTLTEDRKFFQCDGTFLEPGEKFKIVLLVKNADEAAQIYEERVNSGTHVNYRFDYDRKYKTFWLLVLWHPIVQPYVWNQCNIYNPD